MANIAYLKQELSLQKSEEEALLAFKKKVALARSTTTYRKFDNFIHGVSNHLKKKAMKKQEQQMNAQSEGSGDNVNKKGKDK